MRDEIGRHGRLGRRIGSIRAVREDQVLGISIWKLAIIGGIIVLLFGKGKISGMMGDLAQGIKSFKKGMAEDDTAKALGEKADTVAAPLKEKASG
jgi:sec-independent protein translocase protein TatA